MFIKNSKDVVGSFLSFNPLFITLKFARKHQLETVNGVASTQYKYTGVATVKCIDTEGLTAKQNRRNALEMLKHTELGGNVSITSIWAPHRLADERENDEGNESEEDPETHQKRHKGNRRKFLEKTIRSDALDLVIQEWQVEF